MKKIIYLAVKHSKACLLSAALALPMLSSAYAAPAVIDGFRGATFGASETVVRGAISKDFGITKENVKEQLDPRTGTKSLEIKLPKLDPVDAPVTVAYILGYKCRCLIQVNVAWALPENATAAQRDEVIVGASALAKHFASKSWEGGEVFADRISGEPKEGLVTNYFFFRGVNAKSSSVTVWGAPVTLVKGKPGSDNKASAPLTADIDKLRTLAVTYELNIKNPDLRHVSVEGF